MSADRPEPREKSSTDLGRLGSTQVGISTDSSALRLFIDTVNSSGFFSLFDTRQCSVPGNGRANPISNFRTYSVSNVEQFQISELVDPDTASGLSAAIDQIGKSAN
jgi:hypothetical protein